MTLNPRKFTQFIPLIISSNLFKDNEPILKATSIFKYIRLQNDYASGPNISRLIKNKNESLSNPRIVIATEEHGAQAGNIIKTVGIN